MADEQFLTKEIAENFLNDPDSVDLAAFIAVDDAAAEVLARYTKSLCLNNLESLSEEAARALASHSPSDERYRLFDGATLDIGSYYGDVKLTPSALELLAMYQGKLSLGIDVEDKAGDASWASALATLASRQDQRLFRAFSELMEEGLARKDVSDSGAIESTFDWTFDSGCERSSLDVFNEFRDLVAFCGSRQLWWGSRPSDSGGDMFFFAIGTETDVLARLESLPDK